MNGQTKNSKRKQMEEFIARTNPYEKKASLDFDMRGYAEYVKRNHIDSRDIDMEIMSKFQGKNR